MDSYMKQKQIKILGLQETRIGTNTKLTRKEFTWFFSGEIKWQDNFTAGVGFIISNEFVQYITDLEPVSDIE